MRAHHIDATTGDDDVGEGLLLLQEAPRKVKGPVNPQDPSTWGKVGRNDICPCGSGKKHKHCHGAYV